MVFSTLDVEARLSKGSVDADEKVFRENMWSALHTYLLIIEYYISLSPHLHVAVSIKSYQFIFYDTVFDQISGLSAYVILGPKNRPN